MRLALDQAQNAWLVGEVPVGAVIMRAGQVITGYNRPITTHDPTAHRRDRGTGATRPPCWKTTGCRSASSSTLEPCAMCAMALMHARFRRVVFWRATPRPALLGPWSTSSASQLNHHTNVQGGLLEEGSAALLRQFFAERREAAPRRLAQTSAVEGDAPHPTGGSGPNSHEHL